MESHTQKKEINILFKILFFLGVLVTTDFVLGNLLRYMYFRQNSGWLYRTTYAIDSTRADLLIFGSSRANHHYYTREFEQRLNLSGYNTGRDGNAIFYHYAVLQAVLKRYTPKVAILDFSHGEFMKTQDSYDRISSLLPYYEKHPEIRPVIQLKSPYEKYKLASSIYPYNSLLFQIIAGNSGYNKNRQNRNDDYGYVPLHKTWHGPLNFDSTFEKYELDTLKVKYFRSFVKDCVNADIKLYIILSPCYLRFRNDDISVNIARQTALEYHIPFYDFSDEPVFLGNPEIYADESHLNDSGAKLYSEMVIDRIILDFPFGKTAYRHFAALK